MNQQNSIRLLCLAALGLCSAAEAGDSWSMTSLVPFKKKPAARATATVSDTANRSLLPKVPTPELPKLSLPKMEMPGWLGGQTSSRKRNEPSTFQKMNQGTKDAFDKTKEILMPWSVPKKPASKRARSGKSSFLGLSWPWAAQEQKPEVKTIQDFMALERPQF